MNARTLTDRECADIVDYYDRDNSYDTVALKFGIKPGVVQTIMRRLSPGSIRRCGYQIRGHPVVKEFGMSLRALSLYSVGECASCRCEIVSTTQGSGQTCGLCLAYAKLGRAA